MVENLRLLALDGGGVRGLSSLMILQHLMATVDPNAPPKPCEYFDMIGGTSTGGLIAIMLGRLQMTVEECINAYVALSEKVFQKKRHRLSLRGKLQARFDATELEQAVKQILAGRGMGQDTLLKDSDDALCKVFVCATSKQTGKVVCLTSYRSTRGSSSLFESTKIWEACRATSAATSFFDPVSIGPMNQIFVDGALGANNPVFSLWSQAQDVWGNGMQSRLQCLVSIGTGVPAQKPMRDDILGVFATLKKLSIDTENTAEQFHRDKSSLDDEGRYFRFNVNRGLEGIGLEESKKKEEIAAATGQYIATQAVFKQMKACANSSIRRHQDSQDRPAFTQQGVPASDNFISRPADTAELEQALLPQRCDKGKNRRRKVFVLQGLGGIGKTQLAANFARHYQDAFSSVFWLDGRSEDRLRQSIASHAKRIPDDQLSDRSKSHALGNEADLDSIVSDVLDWLARPDNVSWLLVFDNVDQDPEQGGATGAYDVRRYFPGDHGSVLITTRLSRYAQIGKLRLVRKVEEDLAWAIFQQWYGAELVLDDTGKELLDFLDGLPLALAQAACYIQETGLGIPSYVKLYKQQWDDLMRADGKSLSPLVDHEDRSIATTWTISFKAIEARSNSAANLLLLWAFLDNRDFWHGILQAATEKQDWPEWLHQLARNEVEFLDAARLLLRYSMIEKKQSAQGSYTMHPVVHRWTSHIQQNPKKIEMIWLAAMVVGYVLPDYSASDYWVLQQRLLPHAERCWWWIEKIDNGESSLGGSSATNALYNLGNLYASYGRVVDAEKMLTQALRRMEGAAEPESESISGALASLADIYRVQRRLDEAEAVSLRAVQVCEMVFPGDHPQTLHAVHSLGHLRYRQNRIEDAGTMYQRALQGFEKTLGPDDTATLSAALDLARVYQKQGSLKKGEEMTQQTLQRLEEVAGQHHGLTLNAVFNLGIIYQKQGRLEEARALFQRALLSFEKTVGLDHVEARGIVSALKRIDEGRPVVGWEGSGK